MFDPADDRIFGSQIITGKEVGSSDEVAVVDLVAVGYAIGRTWFEVGVRARVLPIFGYSMHSIRIGDIHRL